MYVNESHNLFLENKTVVAILVLSVMLFGYPVYVLMSK